MSAIDRSPEASAVRHFAFAPTSSPERLPMLFLDNRM
jgi:hypothetical protein